MKNVPKIRFKEFQGELRKYKFKELVDLQRGSSPRPITKYITEDDDGVNWVKIGDVSKESTVIKSTKEKITKEGAKKSRYVEIGDLILSNSMSFGRPYIMAIDGYIHDGWFVLKNYNRYFNREYLCQLLISPAIQKQYKRLAAGGVVNNISSELVNSVDINLPSMNEQNKVADYLTKVDKLIEKQDEKVKNLELYKKGMMQKIFSQEIRFRGDKGEMYQEWEEKRLGDTVNFFDNNRRPIKETERNKGIYPYYGATGIIDYIGDYIFEGNYLLLAEDGANIVTRSAPLIYMTQGKFWLNNHAHIFKTKEEYDLLYLKQYLETIDYIPYNTGTAQPKLNIENVKKIIIKYPSLEEQKKIADFLSKIDTLIEKEKEKLENFKSWKKGLLQGMFV